MKTFIHVMILNVNFFYIYLPIIENVTLVGGVGPFNFQE
jgi:hypothetical protein